MSSAIKLAPPDGGQLLLMNLQWRTFGWRWQVLRHTKTQPEPHWVLVGRDPRFWASFVAEACKVLAAGITPIVILMHRPAIAHAVRTLKTSWA